MKNQIVVETKRESSQLFPLNTHTHTYARTHTHTLITLNSRAQRFLHHPLERDERPDWLEIRSDPRPSLGAHISQNAQRDDPETRQTVISYLDVDLSEIIPTKQNDFVSF